MLSRRPKNWPETAPTRGYLGMPQGPGFAASARELRALHVNCSIIIGSDRILNTVTSHDLATIMSFLATAVAGEVERASPWVHTNHTDPVQFYTQAV